jgi:general secretion pathway protein F/type IV pilus assembly protein PilC
VIEAKDVAQAKERLRTQAILVTKPPYLNKFNTFTRSPKLGHQQLLNFTSQLALLLRSGIALLESLTALEEQYFGEPSHPIFVHLCEAIRCGTPLSQAMGHHPQSFSPLYCAMVAAGESCGSLSPVLEKLSELLARQGRLRRQLSTAMVYPCVILTFCILVIFCLLTFAIPSLKMLFEERDVNGFTYAVLGVSDFLSGYWWLYLPLSLLTGWGVVKFLRTSKGRDLYHRSTLQIPLIKTLVIETCLSRFSRTLATLLQGGLPMVASLQLARRVMTNPYLERIMMVCEKGIIEGSSLSAQLRKQPLIPKLLSRMLAVAEEGAEIPQMLHQIADFYEAELEKRLAKITALAQPAILLVMGGIIGLIMLAVLLPLTDVSAFF